ncbi:MAG: hypothetical protein J2P31_17575, partial [Blastocatellia bacterium]|nr:hypothetical protein [Blastocatellia bacterium]
YAPPEHNPYEESSQSNSLTVSADIYSLAKSFYTVICGRAPNQFICDPITSLTDEIMAKAWGRPLTEILARATDDDPARRYGTVVEFWADLAQTATIAEEQTTVAAPDEETVIRPRLKIVPGEMPKSPLQPDFEMALASPGSHASFSTARPIYPGKAVEGREDDGKKEPERQVRRPSKFFVDLQKQAPASVQLPEKSPLVAEAIPGTKPTAFKQPVVKRESVKEKEKRSKFALHYVIDGFSENMRRRLFTSMLCLAFLGSVISVYNFWMSGVSFGSGPPTEIEVVPESLNVRAGMMKSDESILGVIAKGSRHKVLSVNEKYPGATPWIQIQVSRWEKYTAPGQQQNTGWVYGDPNLVRVVSRRWW